MKPAGTSASLSNERESATRQGPEQSSRSRRFDVGVPRPPFAWFCQDGPRVGNPFGEDLVLRSVLKESIPADVLARWEPELLAFGERCRIGGDIYELGKAARAERNEPTLTTYNGWGERVDEIWTCPEWQQLHAIAASEGLLGLAYERRDGAYSRLLQHVKLSLFGPVSAVVTCPLAMTDGAARLIERVRGCLLINQKTAGGQLTLQKQGQSDAELEEMYRRFTTRDPAQFWTSGQWMTERKGGSDVAGTETVAIRQADGRYRLWGYKFFTSATTADVTFTLARIKEEHEDQPPPDRPLSLFCLPVRLPAEANRLNDILVHRLKDKIGTRSLPTAELELVGSVGRLVGEPGRGVKAISSLFNVTRVWAGFAAYTGMRRMLALLQDYSHRREAFGRRLIDLPLHYTTISQLEVRARAMLHFGVELVLLLGREECQGDVAAEALLRLLTPIAKLYGGKQSALVCQEACELFGGAGYMADTGLPQVLNEIQVNTIWEGTTNVLSLDVLRAIVTSRQQVLNSFREFVLSCVEASRAAPRLSSARQLVSEATDELSRYWATLPNSSPEALQLGARQHAFTLARVFAAALLLRHAARTGQETDAYATDLYIELEGLSSLALLNSPGPARALAASAAGLGSNTDADGRPRARF